MTPPRARHEPCVLLRNRGIPCVVWFEDAVACYGVPTVVFDLFILVSDTEEAARALINEGWANAAPADYLHKYHLLSDHPSISHRCLIPTGIAVVDPTPGPRLPSKDPPGPTATILLPAVDWNVSVENLRPSSSDSFAPQLAVLVDALIESLLDSPPDSQLRQHLAVHVCYMYGCCKELKREAFAAHLRPENRQFHCDAISKPGLGTVPFITHQRQIRDEIRSHHVPGICA